MVEKPRWWRRSSIGLSNWYVRVFSIMSSPRNIRPILGCGIGLSGRDVSISIRCTSSASLRPSYILCREVEQETLIKQPRMMGTRTARRPRETARARDMRRRK
jgi:hypothetical protein